MSEQCPLHPDIARRMEAAETRIAALETSMTDLSTSAARGEEQIKTIFRILEELKAMLREYTVEMRETIQHLASDIEGVKMRPARFADGAIASIISAIAGAVVMWLIAGGVQ